MVIGGGFAGFYTMRRLQRVLGGKADLVLVTASDYLLFAPLLPEVANGVLEPRDIAVPYRQTLRGVSARRSGQGSRPHRPHDRPRLP